MMARYALGCIKDPYDHRDYSIATYLKAAPLAERVDHSQALPPVFDQGPAGTCVACATAYYDKSFQEGVEHRWGLTDIQHQFSPLYIYSQRRKQPGDEGMTIREAMKIIQEQGVCSLACMPYDLKRINLPPTAEQQTAAAPYRAKSYARLHKVGEMEAYLMSNCFIAAVPARACPLLTERLQREDVDHGQVSAPTVGRVEVVIVRIDRDLIDPVSNVDRSEAAVDQHIDDAHQPPVRHE